tara:strand:+ start:889 stop:2865 length:1977 start_codon:yes stop_codon:yes gene_type:complete
MATTRITEKISLLVASQFPQFIQNDYTTFIEFVEAYYRFLEQDQGALEIVQNAKSYSDIDSTTEAFVSYFLTNYTKSIPYSVLADKRMFVKKVKDLYESKGSELSFKLLFRLLYDVNVDVTYPYDNVLRASDGEWVQKNTVRVKYLDGDGFDDIVDRYLVVIKAGITYKTSILSKKYLAADHYELVLKNSELAPYEVGDGVTVSSKDGVLLYGQISGTTTGASILIPGKNFRVAQIINVNIAGAVNSQVQVISVNEEGGITGLKILSYGYNFNLPVTVNLSPSGRVSRSDETFHSTTVGFRDVISIQSSAASLTDPTRYFDTDYVQGTDLYSVITPTTATSSSSVPGGNVTGGIDPDLAQIVLQIGAIARYPGKYVSSRGFLSDDVNRLPDGILYQPFAYQTESSLDYTSFYDVVSQLIHPAGQRLFNSRILSATLNAAANVNVISRQTSVTSVQDAFTTLDASIYSMNKQLTDEVVIAESAQISIIRGIAVSDAVTVTDINTLLFRQNTSDDVSITESLVSNFSTSNADTVTATDIIVLAYQIFFNDQVTAIDAIVNRQLAIVYTDGVVVTEATSINTQPALSDDTIAVETLRYTGQKNLTEEIIIADTASINFNTRINNTDSIVTVTEQASLFYPDYADVTYFTDFTYAGTISALV